MNRFVLRRKAADLLIVLACLGITFLMVGPFLWTLVMSFRSTSEILINPYGLPKPFHFKNYVQAFTQFGFARYLLNSTFVVSATIVINTLAAALASYGFARPRYSFRLREPLFYILFVSIMFPPQIFLLSLFTLLVNYGLYNNLWGLILIYSAIGLPFSIFILRSFFAQIPQALDDSARIDGCTSLQTFWRIMFPLAGPALSTVVILNFITYWNEFLFASTFITLQELRTLPLAVMFFMGEAYFDIGMLAVGVIVSSLPIILIYLVLSEKFIKGMTAGALKS